MMDNLKVVGIYPAAAVNHVLHMYDSADDGEKIKVLIQNVDANAIPINELPKRFASRKMIDVKAGELLSLGVIGLYYNFLGNRGGKSFQVVVGVEDALKGQIENILSDGAIWENEASKKMALQQVLVQGYFPKTDITTDQVKSAINDKISKRTRYPSHCGLVVSVYGEVGKINFKEIVDEISLDLYDAVFVVAYHMPQLDTVTVTLLEKGMTAEKFKNAQRMLTLPRYIPGPWLVNDPK